MNLRTRLLTVVLTIPFAGGLALAGDKDMPKSVVSFGTLKGVPAQEAKKQAHAWLTSTGKTDAKTKSAFDAIWSQSDRAVLENVAETLVLGDAEAAKLLSEARDLTRPAPTATPAILKDAKQAPFYRSNLALAYAKALSQRRIYEEALEVLKTTKPETVVDPGTYLFHRAVAEHSLILKDDATRTIVRLLDDAVDVPERYRMVAVLMAFDMQGWREKDLGEIARKMDNIERRLDLSRGGPATQKIQKDVISRLDEIIKQLENENNGDAQCNSGNCPNGGKPGNTAGPPNSPQKDSYGGKNTGPGNVDPKKFDTLVKQWGKLPEKERAKAMQDMTREMPPKYREIIESYFRKLASADTPPRP